MEEDWHWVGGICKCPGANAWGFPRVNPPGWPLISALKGLGHAILGNFSTDQMVIELTKI